MNEQATSSSSPNPYQAQHTQAFTTSCLSRQELVFRKTIDDTNHLAREFHSSSTSSSLCVLNPSASGDDTGIINNTPSVIHVTTKHHPNPMTGNLPELSNNYSQKEIVRQERIPVNNYNASVSSPIVHAIAGSIGSSIALLLFYPLERVRLEIQSNNNPNTNCQHIPSSSGAEEEKEIMDISGITSCSDQQKPEPNKNDPIQHEDIILGDDIQKRQDISASRNCELLDSASVASRSSPKSFVFVMGENDKKGTERSSSSASPSSSTISDIEKDTQASHHSENAQPPTPSIRNTLIHLHRNGQLYTGVKPIITTLAISNFIFFYTKEFVKRYLFKHAIGLGKNEKRLQSLMASIIAGVVNVLCTNPLWVANMSIVAGKKRGEETAHHSQNDGSEKPTGSLFSELKSMVRNEGLPHLWNGTTASLLLVSNPVIQFFTYEQLKRELLSRRKGGIAGVTNASPLFPVEAFILGAVAKSIATVLTYPLQLAQTLLRLQKHKKKEQSPNEQQVQPDDGMIYKGTFDCLLKLYRKRGHIKEWFRGMNAKLLQTVLTSAFTFLSYEQILKVVQSSLERFVEHREIQRGFS